MSKFPTTITELKAGLKAGEFTAVELLAHTYQQIETLETKVDAFLEIESQKAVALEAATEAADAPDEPPGTLFKFHGLRVTLKAEFSLLPPIANSSKFNLPTITAPASFNLVTVVAS